MNDKVAIYNTAYAQAVTNVTTRLGKPATEDVLVWAHLVAKSIASTKEKTVCARCNGTGMTVFTWRERGVCFKCEGSGDSAHPYARPQAQQRVERDYADALEDSYPWQHCAQCGNTTSWTTNEHARTADALICRSCNDSNAAEGTCPGSGPQFYEEENQWEPCDVCGGDCSPEYLKANADVSFDNGALVEACRVCGVSPDTHATVRVDHAYQQGWRNASAA